MCEKRYLGMKHGDTETSISSSIDSTTGLVNCSSQSEFTADKKVQNEKTGNTSEYSEIYGAISAMIDKFKARQTSFLNISSSLKGKGSFNKNLLEEIATMCFKMYRQSGQSVSSVLAASEKFDKVLYLSNSLFAAKNTKDLILKLIPNFNKDVEFLSIQRSSPARVEMFDCVIIDNYSYISNNQKYYIAKAMEDARLLCSGNFDQNKPFLLMLIG